MADILRDKVEETKTDYGMTLILIIKKIFKSGKSWLR